MGNFWQKVGAPAPFDPTASFVTSPVFSPAVLAFIRLTLACYTFTTLVFVLVWDGVRLHTASRCP